MRIFQEARLYSASDLVNFLGCAFATAQDVRQLTEPVEFPPEDAQTKLLQTKGLEHERAYLEQLRAQGLTIAEITENEDNLEVRAAKTIAAMQAGVDVVYQGALLSRPWHGYSDFLLKVSLPSKLGAWSYDVADTKLSRTAKPSHILQLCVYGDLLADAQGRTPNMLHVVLGDGGIATISCSSVHHYYQIARSRFEAFAPAPDKSAVAEPCGHCTYCRWSSACINHWEQSSHLSLVAGITRGQIASLRENSITDLSALANAIAVVGNHGLNTETFAKLQQQAQLQLSQRESGKREVAVLPLSPGKGFNRLPKPDPGDLFFDMEGDPLILDRLEYLFGFISLDNTKETFTTFWAHDRAQEKLAFEAAIDFITTRLAKYPAAHVYHYASYEETALKRLAMLHGTRETEVDDLLRQGRLVDLYKVARAAIRTSEPGYSIKDLEKFYLEDARGGEVKTAGDSIVAYENWITLQDQALLDEIATYNELDCHSTRLCRDWLLTFRPEDAVWRTPGELVPPTQEKLQKRKEAEERTRALSESLFSSAAGDGKSWHALLANLLEFHRREAKPGWWAKFHRQEMTDIELLEDAESLASLSADPTRPPRAEKKSKVYAFTFPSQDFKMRVGDEPLRAGSGEPAGEIVLIDDVARRIELKLGPSRSAIEEGCSLIPEGPIGDRQLRDAVYRYAGAVVGGDDLRYSAVSHVLSLRLPEVTDAQKGAPLVAEGSNAVDGTISVLSRLRSSYLLIQGPPGAGKTYTSSHAIAALLARGAKIGVASNSHKAINNLLVGVQEAANVIGVKFRGIKKSSNEDQFVAGCESIENTLDSKRSVSDGFQLYAGTAWLFAREELDQKLDYLFIDEAGQVSLGNLVAMGVSAKNIVLVGDQMQLAQPIQGDHPGGSGVSCLKHLMAELATVPPDRGIFLSLTHRMHPDVCKFISEAVYDGRLHSEESTKLQQIIVGETDASIAPTGIRFHSVAHKGRSQKSPEEATEIVSIYLDLLKREWVNNKGERKLITIHDILVVSPYNMQVDLLRSVLLPGARVGTVDKFQGQEAAVVLISFATSSGDDLPRHIEFLYSRNRLNVAISRARCLAVIVASPRLLEIACSTIAQIQLVNTLCWAKNYADQAPT